MDVWKSVVQPVWVGLEYIISVFISGRLDIVQDIGIWSTDSDMELFNLQYIMIIFPIPFYLSLFLPQLYHHLRTHS